MDLPPSGQHTSGQPATSQQFRGVIGDTYHESTPDWPSATLPPDGAPNVIVVLFDDLGFGQLAAFGGPIESPNISRLAAEGLRYTNFHTTSLCSPSRAALLTGRNHHSVGFATIAEMASGYPGYNAFMPPSAATIAEVLKMNGYSTMCAGKWHLTPTAEATAAGPFHHWPLGMGFERFYGFLPGETDQWHPMLTADNHRIPTPEHEGYHLSEDLTDQLITMIRDQRQVASGRPFFAYLPFGAVHCPFHAPQSYIDHYRGRFDRGWDTVREETFQRQIELGIVPSDNVLPPRNPGVAAWDDLEPDAQRLYARQMEVFAGMVDHTDAQIGRLLDALDEMELTESTVVMVLSDNGASQEGMRHGATNTERFRNLQPESVEEQLPFLDALGGPTTDPHYPTGWAMAGNTPFRRCKRDTHRGGNTDPLVISWPGTVPDPGMLRTQYHHITDLYPTLLELAGLDVPDAVNGVAQQPIEGESLAATITNPDAATGRGTQYYEMLGSRAIYHDGWMAVTWHKPGTDWADDVWELYDQRSDYTQGVDLADTEPERLAALIELWWHEARTHQVLPLDDRGRDRFIDPTRPTASQPRDVYRYWPGTAPIPNPSMPTILNCPHSFTASFRLDRPGDEGVLVSHGGALAGWVLFVAEGRVHYVNNHLKIDETTLTTPELPVGVDVTLEYRWTPTEVGIGDVELSVDGVSVVAANAVPTARRGYSMVQEGLCIGRSWGPAVTDRYHSPFEFTGTIHHVDLRTDPSRQFTNPSDHRPQ